MLIFIMFNLILVQCLLTVVYITRKLYDKIIDNIYYLWIRYYQQSLESTVYDSTILNLGRCTRKVKKLENEIFYQFFSAF